MLLLPAPAAGSFVSSHNSAETEHGHEYFVRVFPANKPVQTKWTAGTNLCCMTPTYDARTKRLLVSSVIDNIGKGAAGQAIQNMNIIFGLDETTGLKIAPMYP